MLMDSANQSRYATFASGRPDANQINVQTLLTEAILTENRDRVYTPR